MSRWTPSTISLPSSRPTSPSTNTPDIPRLAVIPAVSVPLSTEDSASQDVKLDNSLLQADSLTEILAGTPEGDQTCCFKETSKEMATFEFWFQ